MYKYYKAPSTIILMEEREEKEGKHREEEEKIEKEREESGEGKEKEEDRPTLSVYSSGYSHLYLP